jgi:hypothetical protein
MTALHLPQKSNEQPVVRVRICGAAQSFVVRDANRLAARRAPRIARRAPRPAHSSNRCTCPLRVVAAKAAIRIPWAGAMQPVDRT